MSERRTECGRTAQGLAFRVRGSGPPLLLLSGYGATSRLLNPTVERLVDRYTCITFDYRGTGRSHRIGWPVTTALLAQDALAVLDHLDLDSAHVYGVSMGGMVAQELSIGAPNRVKCLVLVATTPGGWDAVPASPAGLCSSLLELHSSPTGGTPLSLRSNLLLGWAASVHNGGPRLHQISAPTLVLHGDRDVMVPPLNARLLASRIPHAELRVLPGMGHLDLVTDPAAAAVVRDWLANVPVPGAPSGKRRAALAKDLLISAGNPMLPSWHLIRTLLRLPEWGHGE